MPKFTTQSPQTIATNNCQPLPYDSSASKSVTTAHPCGKVLQGNLRLHPKSPNLWKPTYHAYNNQQPENLDVLNLRRVRRRPRLRCRTRKPYIRMHGTLSFPACHPALPPPRAVRCPARAPYTPPWLGPAPAPALLPPALPQRSVTPFSPAPGDLPPELAQPAASNTIPIRCLPLSPARCSGRLRRLL